MDLPQNEKLEDVQKSNKTRGRLGTFLDQVQAGWLSILTLIIIFYGFYNQSQISRINTQINSNQNIVSVPVTLNGEKVEQKQQELQGDTLGVNTEFNPSDWIIDSFDVDKEGYYCPKVKNFEYWSMWSRTKYSPIPDKIRIKILTKPKSGSKFPPTITISYGEYKPNFSPYQLYRLNIFDTDTKTIRLYDSKNNSVAQDWLEKEPDLTNELSITLSPRNPNPNSRIVNLNPSISYVVPNQQNLQSYIPENTFEVNIPAISLDDGTVSKQIGIGSYKDTCIKPTTFEVLR